jgi:periplasmic protein TonB
MRRLIILLLLPFTTSLTGQKVFLDEQKSPIVDPSLAKHFIITNYADNPKAFKVTMYLITGEKESECSYIKSSDKNALSYLWYLSGLSKKYVKNEKSIEWYKNGQVKDETNYTNGVLNGKSLSWYENGQIKSETTYLNNEAEGKSKSWYQNGQLKSECDNINGLYDGDIITYWNNGKIKRNDKYKEGKFQNGICYDSLGKEIDHFDLEVLPKYAGGDQRMMSDIYNNINYPVKSRDNGIQGSVIVRFAVNEQGGISDIDIMQGINEELNNEAVRVIKELRRFKPGYEDGEPAKVYFTCPITFQLK